MFLYVMTTSAASPFDGLAVIQGYDAFDVLQRELDKRYTVEFFKQAKRHWVIEAEYDLRGPDEDYEECIVSIMIRE